MFFFLLAELFIYRNWKETKTVIVFFFLGFSLICLPLFIYFFTATGDPFYYFTEQARVNQQWITFGTSILDISYYPKNMFLIKAQNEPPMYNLYFPLFFIAALYYFFKRTKETNLLLFWSLPILLFLAGIPTLPKVQRYLLLIEIPVILFIAKAIFDFYYTSLVPERTKKIGIICLFLVLLLIGFQQYGNYYIFDHNIVFRDEKIEQTEEAIFIAMKNLPEKDVYITHYNQLPLLNFYFAYTKNASTLYGYKGPTATSFYDLHYLRDINTIHDSYLILDKRNLKNDSDLFGYYANSNGTLAWFTITKIPPNWHVLLRIGKQSTTYTALFYVE